MSESYQQPEQSSGTGDHDWTAPMPSGRAKASGDMPVTPARALSLLMHQLSRELHTQFGGHGLHAVQWSALRYFESCDSSVATVSGLAQFQGTTLGSASRTISTLIGKGCLSAIVDNYDRRTKRLSLTDRGRSTLVHDPLRRLEDILADLDQAKAGQLHSDLQNVLDRLLIDRRQPRGHRRTAA